MPYTNTYLTQEPAREEIDARPGTTLLEFGAPDCGFCAAIQPAVQHVLEDSDVEHLKIHDASGRHLGRSFRVKLWPTFVAMRDGEEVGRVVRPFKSDEIAALLA